MASGRLQFLTCSKCYITVRDSGNLNPSCYKCHSPLQANNRKARSESGRSGNLGWSGRSGSSREQQPEEESAFDDGRTSDVESRAGGGGLGWRSRSSWEQTELLPADHGRPVADGTGGGRDAASNLLQFESTVTRLALRVDQALVVAAASDSEASRTLHGSRRRPLFSSSASVVSSEDTFDGGDDTSSWNGDYPGSPHSADRGAYEPSVASSEDGYLSRGVSRRTRKSRASSNQVGGSSFESTDVVMDAVSRGEVPPQGRFVPPLRPRGERFLSDTSGSLGGSSSGNRSQVLEASSSSGSRELSGYNWAEDPMALTSSSSGELSRTGGGLRPNQYGGSGNQHPAVRPHRPNAEESGGRMSVVDGLREVNPYGSRTSRSQALSTAGGGARLPPPPSHYQPSPSASRSSIHCCAHCRSDTCRVFEQLGIDVCCVNGDCSTCSHSCCQPLGISAGQQCHGKPNPFIPSPTSNNAQEHHAHQQVPKAKEKKKRFSRPVFGGANFIICYECDELLQMPEDFHFSRTRRNRLRCGSCSEIIVYCLVDMTRIVPYNVAVNQKILGGGVEGGNHRVSKSHPAASSTKGEDSNHSRTSYADNNSAYSDGAGSTEGEADSVPGKNALRQKKEASLHRLMGYFSARDIIY